MKRKPALRRLFNIQGGLCAYCKTPMDIHTCNKPDSATLDHILPKSKYKSLSRDDFNLVCACNSCNQKKADMPLAVFIAAGKDRNQRNCVVR